MESNNAKINLFLLHTAVWVAYVLYEVTIVSLLGDKMPYFWDTLLHFALNIGLFYGNYIVIGYLLLKKYKIPYYILLCLLLLAIYTLLLYLLKTTSTKLNIPISYPITSYYTFIIQGIWRGMYFIGLSYGYWFARSAIENEKKIRIKQSEELNLQNEIVLTQLSFLKSQINPHFLFNTLNFLYSQVYGLSRETAGSILLLSDIMRYGLQNPDEDGKSYLNEEINHLKSYIAINQLRFDNKLHIVLTLNGQFEFRKVPSLILITIIENAFKHGDLNDPDFPCLINISVYDNLFDFYIINKKNHLTKPEPSGIGLVNIKQRLNIIYKSDYVWQIEEDENSYALKLQLKI
ncbi:sensor histidine kinase YesM [Pedobacter cryoconitis]|uniref:Sensor histidine kinase YesM n=1 Tax=Pedobacter cryoconitis TaxID=188932 RepID=A0A7W9DX25_9SPHI|nr:histidine kinase [Pedobacter cryoconitis]MBB5634476.1 sensor histidine kinase YesM [Pedobacter cryoconitis]